MAKGQKALIFSARLGEALVQHNVSIRGLAKRINPEDPESARRNLHRWLAAENYPSKASRQAIADGLGITREELDPDEEEESSPSLAELLEFAVSEWRRKKEEVAC